MPFTSKFFADAFNAKLTGQQLLFEDYDLILRRTPFKDLFEPQAEQVRTEFNRTALIHWWMNVYVPNGRGDQETPYEVYRTWSNAMWQNFKYVSCDGYRIETNQNVVKIACCKKEPLEPQLEELKLWIPHIKESMDEEQRMGKHISIFERGLCEYAIYSLAVYSDLDIVIGEFSHGSYKVVNKFDNLAEAVDLIRNKYWYTKGSSK